MLIKFIELIGAAVEGMLIGIGKISLLLYNVLRGIFKPPYEIKNTVRQMLEIGVNSLPVVLITAVFTGMVLALQSYTGFKRFGAEGLVGSIVSLSMTRELGPVLTALIVTGRAGASMAAELGTMRVTEQIDALETLATNPVKYLVVPRFISGIIMLPALVVVTDIVGIIGGYFVTSHLSAVIRDSMQRAVPKGSAGRPQGLLSIHQWPYLYPTTSCPRGFLNDRA